MDITIDAVEKRYGSITALDGVSFDIPAGSTFGVLGTNGAGKTTLFEILVGHAPPDAGRITIGGVDTQAAGASVRKRIGFLPEQVGFPGLLTGREVLRLQAQVREIPALEETIDDALDAVGLAEDADRRVSGYSNGMQGRLGLAAALLADPAVLVLDEPTAGLDPRGVARFHEIINRIQESHETTIVMSSHVLSDIEQCCDAVAILHEGNVRLTGEVEELRSRPDGKTRMQVEGTSPQGANRLSAALADTTWQWLSDTTIEVKAAPEELVEVISALPAADVGDLTIDPQNGLEATFLAATSEVS